MATGILAPQPDTQLGFEFVPAAAPPRFWRLVRETTRQAWYVVRDTLPNQQRACYVGLMAYWNRYQCWPTSQELLEFLLALKAKHPGHPRYRCISDINSVRPALTYLNQNDPPLVVTGEPRLCTSVKSGAQLHRRPVLTWRVPQLGEAVR